MVSVAQPENAIIRKGNRFYREKQLDQAQLEYQKAIGKSPTNPIASYNLGNAQFRKNDFEAASKSYDASIQNSPDKPMQEKGYYNKGVSFIKGQKLQESIDAWKNALKLDPADVDARENLQKALLEQKNNQPKQQKKESKPESKKPEQSKDQQKDQQPKQPQSKLSKQQVEQLLSALQQREKEVQNKMNQNKQRSLSQPEKDW